MIADRFLGEEYYRTCYIKLIDLTSGRRPEFFEIHVILEDRPRLELSSIFIDTLLHEATKKRERNAPPSATRVLFITAAASASRCAVVTRVSNITHALLRLSSLSLACVSRRLIEEVLRDREAAERQTVAKPLPFILSGLIKLEN